MAKQRKGAIGGIVFAIVIVLGAGVYLYSEARVGDDANWHQVPGRYRPFGFTGKASGEITVTYLGSDGEQHDVEWKVGAGSVQYLIDKSDRTVTVWLFKTLIGRERACVDQDLATCKAHRKDGWLGGLAGIAVGIGLLYVNIRRYRGTIA